MGHNLLRTFEGLCCLTTFTYHSNGRELGCLVDSCVFAPCALDDDTGRPRQTRNVPSEYDITPRHLVLSQCFKTDSSVPRPDCSIVPGHQSAPEGPGAATLARAVRFKFIDPSAARCGRNTLGPALSLRRPHRQRKVAKLFDPPQLPAARLTESATGFESGAAESSTLELCMQWTGIPPSLHLDSTRLDSTRNSPDLVTRSGYGDPLSLCWGPGALGVLLL